MGVAVACKKSVSFLLVNSEIISPEAIWVFAVKRDEYVNKTLRLSKALVDELATYAAKSGISLNELVAQSCRYALDHREIKEEDQKHV